MIVLTLTFASIDWMMSLEPRWNSTMYGITFTVGCGLSAFAFVTFFLARLATTDAMKGILKPTHLRDLGNLMLAFVMFYAYTAFSEFLLIWYANLREEIPHYVIRDVGAWGAVAAIIIVMRYVAIYWLVAPGWYGDHFHYSIWNVATLIGIGGVWLYAFIDQLKGQTIIPIHETWVEEAVREGALRVNA